MACWRLGVALALAAGLAIVGASAQEPPDARGADPRILYSGEAIWSGAGSLGGAWIAHPAARGPVEVVVRRPGGAEADAMWLKRGDGAAGPLVSDVLARALGMPAGAPTEIEVVARAAPSAKTTDDAAEASEAGAAPLATSPPPAGPPGHATAAPSPSARPTAAPEAARAPDRRPEAGPLEAPWPAERPLAGADDGGHQAPARSGARRGPDSERSRRA